MTSLSPASRPVHSNPITALDLKRARMWGLKLPAIAEPMGRATIIEADDRDYSQPFAPTEAEDHYWSAFTLAYQGEPGQSRSQSWANGTRAGVKAREIADARELGLSLGRSIGGCQPPLGFQPWEKEAFRDGLAIAEQEAIEEAREEAIEYECRREMFEEVMAPLYELTDADFTPPGGMV
jgi:hypothetical protein